ncbi:hypothetical protein CMI47_15350 [Candidatus Pacearchaeota archaeon]|nr:hypothetical protein [Candidatus Pacearchaeota archaeon]|tara:strand:+ start:17614 stop:18744 length:1131 start_codon:yes stop_codon:yes gene_type:complete
MVKKYNFVIVVLDGARLEFIKDLRNFKSLCEKGTFFSKMITYGAQTVMSMHATFTGIYGNINGADNYFGSALFRNKSCKTLAQYLKDDGYYTLGDTINEIVVPGQGFEELRIHDEKKDDLTERHKEMIKEVVKLRDEDKNFFLYVHYSNIHTGMVKTVLKKYGDFEKDYFANKEKNIENYKKYVGEADTYVGELLKTCEEVDLFKDTIFIVMSDHGSSVGDKIGEIGYGRYCYDYTMNAFSIFVGPEIFSVKEVNKVSRTVDILPTILDILKLEEDKKHRKVNGKSLLPLIDNNEKRIAYSESAGLVDPYPTKDKPLLKCVRQGDWKLIYNVKTGEKELYNLTEDEKENENIFEKNSEKTEEMFAEIVKLNPEMQK